MTCIRLSGQIIFATIKQSMEKNTITRQELYDMVWKEPVTVISRRLNIPYSHLRKICNELNVPTPLNGHWSKLQFGKSVEIIELPQDYQGEIEIKLDTQDEDIIRPELLTLHKTSAVEFIRKDKTLQLKVPKKLTDPDNLVVTAHKDLLEHPHRWYNRNGMLRTSSKELKMRVAPVSINRALCFMDTLIKLLRARGHNLIVEYEETCAIVEGEKFKLSLVEINKQIKFGSEKGGSEYKATGLFSFSIEGYYGHVWNDGKILIEEKLAEILVKLETEAAKRKAERLVQEELSKIREAKERIKKDKLALIEKDRLDFKDLYKQAKRWQRARLLRDYITAVEHNAIESRGLTEDIQDWVNWAKNKVDWYDPLINKNDELQNDIDKNTLD
jgi:hypothetical protein